ncbi:hypothetical protein HUO13_15480 [Saccharopolyspora erythraea]|uniref:hypothetical protein n=1 Tax=Saccharopolyspora erythraea TaxID=1836 RepID=UPI001BA568ED|nr:hypothetical protein [Saccharopolyspora erythraea]QUH02015.1 hypothetical protein HUO13_15480 [Saccharopolyspora erythraea]
MSVQKMRFSAVVLAALVSTVGVGSSSHATAAEKAVTAGQAAAPDVAASCGSREFCLYSGAHQTGEILFRREVVVHPNGNVALVHEENVDPLIHPRSARLPGLPEGLACIAVLYEEPHYGGDTQEAGYGYPLDDVSLVELNGRPVGTIDSDCG